MNRAPAQGGCRGGSPFASPQAGAFNRDDTFLEQAISVNKSQVEGNLFNGNEASLRLDFNPGPETDYLASSTGRGQRICTLAALTAFAAS